MREVGKWQGAESRKGPLSAKLAINVAIIQYVLVDNISLHHAIPWKQGSKGYRVKLGEVSWANRGIWNFPCPGALRYETLASDVSCLCILHRFDFKVECLATSIIGCNSTPLHGWGGTSICIPLPHSQTTNPRPHIKEYSSNHKLISYEISTRLLPSASRNLEQTLISERLLDMSDSYKVATGHSFFAPKNLSI